MCDGGVTCVGSVQLSCDRPSDSSSFDVELTGSVVDQGCLCHWSLDGRIVSVRQGVRQPVESIWEWYGLYW